MKTKKKISRILGVGLSLALLSSMVILPAPVSAATQAWGTFATPAQGAAGGFVLDTGNTWTGPFAQASNGDIYAASDVGGGGATLVKSIDGGRTWTAPAGFPAIGGAPGAITDIVTSSKDANTVYVTDGFDIWKTADGGTTWAPLSNLFTSVPLTYGLGGSGYITSLDVGYLGDNPYIFAGLSAYGVGGTGGGAYVAEEAVYGMPWTNLLIGSDRPVPFAGAGLTDVTDIRVDPAAFAATQMVMAIVTDRTSGNTLITTKYGGAQWDATVNDVGLNTGTLTSTLYSSSLWLPSNFNSSLGSGLMQAYAGVDSSTAGQGDVFLAVFAAPAAPIVGTAAFDLNVNGVAIGTGVTGLDGIGPIGSATLLASGYASNALTTPAVFRSSPGAFTWLANAKRPTGGASPFFPGNALSSVLVLSTTDALVGTHGVNNGVSITNDFGRTWNGISLLNTVLGTIGDLAFAPDGSIFMATDPGPTDQLWRFASNWERVNHQSLLGGLGSPDMVRITPDGSAVFWGDLTAPSNIWRSTDNGQAWTVQTNNIQSTGLGTGTLSTFIAIDANTLVVGDAVNANTVYRTATNGGFWFAEAVAVGTVTSLARDAGTGDILVGGITGAPAAIVARSQDSGDNWTVIATPLLVPVPVPFFTAGNVIVAFSDDYGNNGTIFVTGTDTGDLDAGIYSYDYTWATPAWTRIDNLNPYDLVTPLTPNPEDVNRGTGLVAAPGGASGMVYAADRGAGQGVSRIRYFPPTPGPPLVNINVAEQMPDAPPAPALTSTFGGGITGDNNLWVQPGSNVLYAIDTANGRIRTYTDTLNVSGAGVAVSAVTATTATVSWDALPNTASYTIVVNTTAQANFYTALNAGTLALPGALVNGLWTVPYAVLITGTTAAITGLTPNTTYQVSVWAATPVSSFLFDGAATSFLTLPGAPIAPPLNLLPINGAVNIPVSGPAFAWAAPPGGAISYNFELSQNPQFLSQVAGSPRSVTVPYLVWDEPLEYETAYYWRVQSVTGAGESGWVTSIFTTVAEAPDLEVPPPPTPIITIEIPEIEFPEFPEIPDIILPEIEIPDIDITLPPIELPEIILPPIEIPDIEVVLPPIEIPDIVIPDIVIPPLEQPDVIVNLPPPITTIVSPVIEAPPTPGYVWAIVGIGAVLSIAVIVLIVRTRRIV